MIIAKLKCLFTRHVVCLGAMTRISGDEVIAPCHRCGKMLSAYCGLALNCDFIQDAECVNCTCEKGKNG